MVTTYIYCILIVLEIQTIARLRRQKDARLQMGLAFYQLAQISISSGVHSASHQAQSGTPLAEISVVPGAEARSLGPRVLDIASLALGL